MIGNQIDIVFLKGFWGIIGNQITLCFLKGYKQCGVFFWKGFFCK
jgi:hypothetical protein